MDKSNRKKKKSYSCDLFHTLNLAIFKWPSFKLEKKNKKINITD